MFNVGLRGCSFLYGPWQLYERLRLSRDDRGGLAIVRLTDEWYDLFGVKSGEKLYVAPVDRVKIW